DDIAYHLDAVRVRLIFEIELEVAGRENFEVVLVFVDKADAPLILAYSTDVPAQVLAVIALPLRRHPDEQPYWLVTVVYVLDRHNYLYRVIWFVRFERG